MLSLTEIKKFYPNSLHTHANFLVREYLQYKILEAIYESEFAGSLIFMGGTCLRIRHDNIRFSEDLDFDNHNLNEKQFSALTDIVSKKLVLEGYETTTRIINRQAFHCQIRFPGLLFTEGLTSHQEQQFLIQLDTEPQNYVYLPEKYLLNKFDVFTGILVTPAPVLLAQKIFAVLNRKRNKGRDFYDIVFLLSFQKEPDWNYLDNKLKITSKVELKERLLDHCKKIDLREMARDVEPFLFRMDDVKKVILFTDLIAQVF